MSTGESPKALRADCPDCGHAFGVRAAPGTAITCPSCGAPFVLRAREPKARSTPVQPATPAPAPVATDTVPEVPWLKVLLTVLALLVAHVGVYQLLTSSDRGELDRIRAEYDGIVPEAKPDPGTSPDPGTPAYKVWNQTRRANADAARYEELASKVGVTRTWLTLAFFLQVGLLGFALFRTASKLKRRNARGRR